MGKAGRLLRKQVAERAVADVHAQRPPLPYDKIQNPYQGLEREVAWYEKEYRSRRRSWLWCEDLLDTLGGRGALKVTPLHPDDDMEILLP